jgi:hypothetical protein
MAKRRKAKDLSPRRAEAELPASTQLLAELRELIQATRSGVAQAVNSAQVVLHWRIGDRIHSEILGHKRAAYGDELIATVARDLTADYGRGFAEKSLRRMVQFARVFADFEIVAALSPWAMTAETWPRH